MYKVPVSVPEKCFSGEGKQKIISINSFSVVRVSYIYFQFVNKIMGNKTTNKRTFPKSFPR